MDAVQSIVPEEKVKPLWDKLEAGDIDLEQFREELDYLEFQEQMKRYKDESHTSLLEYGAIFAALTLFTWVIVKLGSTYFGEVWVTR